MTAPGPCFCATGCSVPTVPPAATPAATLAAAGDEMTKRVPLGRIGRPDDMAGIAVFLSSRAGSYLTGTIIPVDGGIAT